MDPDTGYAGGCVCGAGGDGGVVRPDDFLKWAVVWLFLVMVSSVIAAKLASWFIISVLFGTTWR